MIDILLQDGRKQQFNPSTTVCDVIAAMDAQLTQIALAATVNGKLVDLSYRLEKDSTLNIITASDPQGLEIIRHSTAHLLAHAIKQLFPKTQITIGPVITDGFYYDFAMEHNLSVEELPNIEAKMRDLAKKHLPIERVELSHDEAIAFFASYGEHYKVKIIETLANTGMISLYRQGDFVDLCQGPHVPHTGHLKAFKLTKIAGAYWRGDSNEAMLQRVYGTAWQNQSKLEAYLKRLEEAKKRDHRKIGAAMNLFHLQKEAPGMIFWHPNGWVLNRLVRNYISTKQQTFGYQEVNTPGLIDSHLWELSGHASKFDDDMFTSTSENRDYIIKPMNCPAHVQIFNQGMKSYRDLPLRYAEFGCCHRNEPSGTLHGMMRLRAFVQDDAHIFCREDQVYEEVLAFIRQTHKVYQDFGFKEILIQLSTRPQKRVGNNNTWDKTENMLQRVLNDSKLQWSLNPGEGAFYGPKIEFSLKDSLSRIWQCGTIQLDSSTPERLGARYIDQSGKKQIPYMLHRAMLGSIERFLGILLEEYTGKLPLWLAPVQLTVLNIATKHQLFCKELAEKLQRMAFRVKTDLRNEKISFKIREQILAKVPYALIIGDKEIANGLFSLRKFNGEKTKSMNLDHLMLYLKHEIKNKN